MSATDILLLGAGGQLGWALEGRLAIRPNTVSYTREQCDLTDPARLQRVIEELRPKIIINAAAYTAVDRAETEQDLAFRVNSEAPELLAQLARRTGALLIHFSTDYVFDGTKPTPYVECDVRSPLSIYGRSKAEGEGAIMASECQFVIFRTSWVYGPVGGNFMRTVLRLASERSKLSMIADQFGAPTSVELLADVVDLWLDQAIAGTLHAAWTGLFHLAPTGVTTWHGYATTIVDSAISNGIRLNLGKDDIAAIATADYPLPAKRPLNSRLDCSKLTVTTGIELPDWSFHVHRAVKQFASNPLNAND